MSKEKKYADAFKPLAERVADVFIEAYKLDEDAGVERAADLIVEKVNWSKDEFLKMAKDIDGFKEILKNDKPN